ncbi:hypothetical protein [Fulvivirga lutimaris]|uniref:hypothetical protein n=1 Tax=Fulvivirga lutimaris TaxID=1819566 RepID=UPI0012BC253D|nr:hypothetical protein [Fulvivirga lutimaris]MTI38070.1 hypothetical protein [Fulvivirga lutimaris]
MKRSIQDFKWHIVWKKITSEEVIQIVGFWLRLGILSRPEAYKRANQVVIMIKNKNDELIGVSTAFPTYFDQLRAHVYAYRCLIKKDSRVIGLETKLTLETKSVLQKGLSGVKENKPVGLLAVVQNERLSNDARYAVWPGVNMIYVGNNNAGHSIRVSYFDHVKLN